MYPSYPARRPRPWSAWTRALALALLLLAAAASLAAAHPPIAARPPLAISDRAAALYSQVRGAITCQQYFECDHGTPIRGRGDG